MEQNLKSTKAREIYVSENLKSQMRIAFTVHGDTLIEPKEYKFFSNPIRVISKPSKNKNAKIDGLCIHSGQTIVMYNRLRSQTATTRFLAVKDDFSDLVPVRDASDPWCIWVCMENDDVNLPSWNAEYDQTTGILNRNFCSSAYPFKLGTNRAIKYGDVVVLENLKSGICTFPMKLRSVTNNLIAPLPIRGGNLNEGQIWYLL